MPTNPRQPWRRLLTCGQMAKANCITMKTLRFYQKKGLLEPDYVDEETGYRYYGILQATKLDMITHLRTMGFSLDEIREIDASNDVAYLQDVVCDRLNRIHQQQRELAAAEHLAADLIDDCESYLTMPLIDHPMLENLPDRRILEFDIAVPPEVAAGHTDLSASDLWEWVVREVKQAIVARGWPLSLFRNVGFIIHADEMAQEGSWMNHAFVLVDESQGECYEHGRLLPGGSHAVLYIDRGYGDDGAALDGPRFEKLQEFIDENGLEVAGNPYCEAICRYQRFFNLSLDSFSRYCVPVRNKIR